MTSPILVTESALTKVQELLKNAPAMIGVRPFVYGGGCSGMQHSMTFVEKKELREYYVLDVIYIGLKNPPQTSRVHKILKHNVA